MKLHFWLAPLLFAVSLPAWTDATVYRWKDASGQTHFGQTPPTTGAYDVMRGAPATPIAPPSTTPAAPASPSMAGEQKTREQKFIEEAEAARKAKAEAKAKEKTAKAEKEQRCKVARENVHAIEERHGYVGMPMEEYTRSIEAARKDVASNCG